MSPNTANIRIFWYTLYKYSKPRYTTHTLLGAQVLRLAPGSMLQPDVVYTLLPTHPLRLSLSQHQHHHLFVEVKLIRLTRSLDLAGIRILQILLNDVVPVLPYCS